MALPLPLVIASRRARLNAEGTAQSARSADILPLAIAANWSRLARSHLSTGLYSRLLKMARRGPGWRGPGSRPLSSGSLRFFLEFWTLVRGSALEPQIALTPNGHLQAIWYRNSRRSLDIEFVETGEAFFGLFDGRAIVEGVENILGLAHMIVTRENKPLK